jgi:collagenase-like PrtC family protease
MAHINLDFSIPYNDNEPELLPELLKLNKVNGNSIREVYLSGPQEYSGSGRVMPRMDFYKFVEIVERIRREGVRVNITLNPICAGLEWYSRSVIDQTVAYIECLHKELGVEAVTIANPLYITEIRKKFPDLEINASVLGDIDCVQRAVIYKNAGADVITTDASINRNLTLLKQIKDATNIKLRLMVNEGCLYKCPFRKFHFNAISHASADVTKVGIEISHDEFLNSCADIDRMFFNSCNGVIGDDLSQLLKSCWIRPEDLEKYSEITGFFKVVGRNVPGKGLLRMTEAYLNESWDGDLLDIIDGSLRAYTAANGACINNKVLDNYRFFEKVTSCDSNCSQCNYCNELSRQIVRMGEYSDIKREYVYYYSKNTKK